MERESKRLKKKWSKQMEEAMVRFKEEN